LRIRIMTATGAVMGMVLGLAASWLVLLVTLATVFLLLVAIIVLLFTSIWPWAIMGALAVVTLLLRRLGRSSGRPREPQDIRQSF
jgi:hypothetical protein